MMNIILVIGLLTLSQSLHGQSENDLSASSTISKEALNVLCEIFPKYLKFNCKSDESEAESQLKRKDHFNLHVNLQMEYNKKSASPIETVPNDVDLSDVTDPVLQKVKALCSVLPHPLKDSCFKVISLTSREDVGDTVKIQILKGLYEIIETHYKGSLGSYKTDIISKEHPGNPVECVLCKLIMKALQKILDRNPTKEKIEKALSKVCNAFHGEMKGKCRRFIIKFAGKIVDLLLKKKSPGIICKLLLLCSDKLTDEEMKIIDTLLDTNELLGDSSDKKEKQEKSASPIQTVPNDITPSDVTDPIVQKAISLCSVLSSPLNESCVKIIRHTSRGDIEDALKIQNLKLLYEIFEAHDKGNIDSLKNDIDLKEHPGNPAECLLCKLIMKALQKILARDPSKEKIEKALGKVCKVFHGKTREKCEMFIHKFAGKIVDFLLKKYPPKALCKLLMLCSDTLTDEEVKMIGTLLNEEELLRDSSDEKDMKNNEEKAIKQDNANPLECSLCKHVLKALIKLIGSKKSKDEIERALKKVCHVLPGFMRHKCEDFVHKYGDKIIHYIIDNQGPSKICSLLHLCSTNDDSTAHLEKANVL